MAVQKTTPLLDDLRAVSTAQREEFRENGHILVRGLLSSGEIAVYRPLIADAVRRYRAEKRRHVERDHHGRALLPVMNLWRSDEGVKRFVLSRRLGKVAADLLGVGNVRIYHDQAFFREPGGGVLPWHQDQYYRPLDTANTITCWMPLVDIEVDMGMLTFAVGSHKQGLAPDQRPGDESETRKYIKDHQFPIARAAGMRAGDASWHYGNTVHCVPANESDRMREVMTVIYMADGARVVQPANESQVNDWNSWLMGLPPGRLAASELNPLVL